MAGIGVGYGKSSFSVEKL